MSRAFILANGVFTFRIEAQTALGAFVLAFVRGFSDGAEKLFFARRRNYQIKAIEVRSVDGALLIARDDSYFKVVFTSFYVEV